MRLFSLLMIGFCSLTFSYLYCGSPQHKDKADHKEQKTKLSSIPKGQDSIKAGSSSSCICCAPHCPQDPCQSTRRLSK